MLKTKNFLHKCQHPLLLAAGSVPLAVLLAARVQPQVFRVLPCFPAAYVLLAWLCLLVPGRWRLFAAGMGSAVLAGLAAALLPLRQEWTLLLLPIGYAALLFAVLPAAGWPSAKELPPAWPVGGLAAHVLAQLICDHAVRSGSALYRPVRPLLLVSFLLFIVLVLLAVNRLSLESAAQSRVQVPVRMRRQNILLTLGLLLAAILLAAVPAIGAFLARLWELLAGGIRAAAAFLAGLLAGQSPAGSGGGEGGFSAALGPPETTEPALWVVVLEKICYVLALAVAAVLLYLLLRKLIKVLYGLLRQLWQQLGRFGSAASRDYEDEITDTRDGAQYERKPLGKRIRNAFARTDESKLSPAERVRWRYRRLRRRHTDWQPASTARETLPGEAAQLYERARYGAQTLTDEEAERFRIDTRKL